MSTERRAGEPRRDGRRKGCRAKTCLSQELQDKGGFKTCGVSWDLAAEAKAIKEEHRKKEKRIGRLWERPRGRYIIMRRVRKPGNG